MSKRNCHVHSLAFTSKALFCVWPLVGQFLLKRISYFSLSCIYLYAVILLSFWAEVHYNSIYPQGGNFSSLSPVIKLSGLVCIVSCIDEYLLLKTSMLLDKSTFKHFSLFESGATIFIRSFSSF